MSYKETIQANNTAIASANAELEELIDMANALPDAGGGSGEIPTCTIRFVNEIANLNHGVTTYAFTTYKDGAFGYMFYDGEVDKTAELVFENVVCGSVFYIADGGYSYAGKTSTDNIEWAYSVGNGYASPGWYLAPTEAGAEGVITAYDDD